MNKNPLTKIFLIFYLFIGIITPFIGNLWVSIFFVSIIILLHLIIKKEYEEIKDKSIEKLTLDHRNTLDELYNEHIFAITHELRSPLAVINASVNTEMEHLRNIFNNLDPNDPEQINVFREAKKKLLTILEQIDIIDSFISNLAEYGSYTSRSEDGQKILFLTMFLQNILKNASNFSYSMKVFNENIKFYGRSILDFDQVHVQVNPNDLARILMNIFKNSGDAIWKNFGKLNKTRKDWRPELTISCIKSKCCNTALTLKDNIKGPFGCKRKESPFYLIISDNGPGISNEHKSKIFSQKFSTHCTKDNLGMGLQICMDLAKKNDLSIFFRTNDEGTDIIIGFPSIILIEEDKKDPTKGTICKNNNKLYYSDYSEKLYKTLVKKEIESKYSLIDQFHQSEY